MKIYLSVALLALAISFNMDSVAAGRNGYRLVYVDISTAINSEASSHFMRYFNSELSPETYRCADGNRLVEIDIVYVKKRPKAITSELIASSVQGNRDSLKRLRKALRTYRDSEVERGFDGLVAFKNEGSEYTLTTISAIDRGYERTFQMNYGQSFDAGTLKNLTCGSLSRLPYAYLE